MAILRTKDITNMSPKEQQEKIEDLRKELMKLKSQIAMGSMPESPGRVKELKRTIARLSTIKGRTIQKQ